MALRHIALFRWSEGVTSEQVARVEEELSRLPGVIPQLDGYSFGRDLGIGADTFDFAVVADVADEDAFAAYRDHPEHQEVLGVIRPLLAERASVQFRTGTA
ncbi:Dabb family protein [Streptomonospora litoralis]|uniref:Stress responsive A/B Barrel Domain protein n=1 Tax=Streptomonospora litoralis TaxID=2498135 RepID=A0A4P6Q4S4_9ACTN|nr:Dabb family protein [Streptomonospora litoralis]QBI55593.1 Stress responsive A/B Barrel Domain protein [Streptomonospora litoralis]